MAHDGLITAERSVGGAYAVAAAFEFGAHRWRNAVFHRDEAVAVWFFAGRFDAAIEAIARRVARGLQIEIVVDEVDDDLHVTLRLHVAAHQAEREPRLAVAQCERGNDGLERAASGPVLVRARREREEFAAILQHEAQAIGHQARAHAAIVRLDD